MRSIDDWLTKPDGLATRLRELRRDAGLTGEQLAAAAGWRQSKVSRLENGRQMPTADDVAVWVRLCHAEESGTQLQALLAEALGMHQQFRHRMRAGQAAVQRDLDGLARAASRIRNVEPIVVPGLLQVPGYALARIEENVRRYGADPAETAAAVAARLRRQEVLYDTTKQLEFVLSEACLRLMLAPPAAMAAQLDRLTVLAGGSLPNVTVGIIPFGVQLAAIPLHGWLMLDDLAIVETLGGETVHQGEEADTYATATDELMAQALTGEPARQLIASALAELQRAG